MHKVDDILNVDYQLLTKTESRFNEFDGVYTTDLLSSAIKHIKHKEVLVTIIATQTAISLAVMLDVEVLIIPAGIHVEESFIQRANKEYIAVISTQKLTHEVIIDLHHRGLV